MICRIWHGWTTPAHADEYERILREEIFSAIAEREIPGYHGIQLLRRPLEKEVEFVTMMWFDDLAAVRAFAGEDYERAVLQPSAQRLLARYDRRSAHFTVQEDRRERA